jgi:hypothetical protein
MLNFVVKVIWKSLSSHHRLDLWIPVTPVISDQINSGGDS